MQTPDHDDQAARPDPADLLRESRWVERLALRLVGDAAAAKDLSQEVMVVALRQQPSRAEDTRPWLASVLRRLALRWRRDQGRARAREDGSIGGPGEPGSTAEPASQLPSTDELVAQAELRRWVAEEVEKLPEPGRSTVMLRYFRDLSAAEIARLQGIPAGTVRARLKRSLDVVREAMNQRSGEDQGRSHWALTALGLPNLGANDLPFPPASTAAPSPHPIPAPAVAGAPSLPLLAIAMSTKLAAAGLAALCIVAIGGVLWRNQSAEPLPPLGLENEETADLGEAATTTSAEGTAASASRRESASAAPVAEPEVQDQASDGADLPEALVRARLVNHFGQPLQGAELRWVDGDGIFAKGVATPSGQVELARRTGAEGESAVCVAAYPGLAQRFERTQLRPGETNDLGELILGPAGSIAGDVVDGAGNPIEGARVVVVDPANIQGLPAELRSHGPKPKLPVPSTTTRNGSFLIHDVATGFQQLWADAPGFAYTASEPIEVLEGVPHGGIVLVLEPLIDDSRISGIVLDPEGQPLGGQSVRYSFRHPGGGQSAGFRTKPDGTFSLLLNKRVPHDFIVLDNSGGRWTTVVHAGVAPGTADLALQFQEPATTEVLVQSKTGPLPNQASLAFYPDPRDAEASPLEGLPLLLRKVDHLSSPIALPVPPDSCQLTVTAPGFAIENLGPFQAGTVPKSITVTLIPLPGIRGIVMADGEPVPGAKVELGEILERGERYLLSGYPMNQRTSGTRAATTDGQGRFVLHMRGNGRYVVRASADGYATTESAPLELDAKQGRDGVELSLGPGGSIEGRLIDPEGGMIAGTIVAASRGDKDIRNQRVGADGRFAFSALTPGRWNVIEVEEEYDPGLPSYTYSSSLSQEIPTNCEVIAGRVTQLDLRRKLDLPRRLEGYLRFSGQPCIGWTVRVLEIQPSAAEDLASATTDAYGIFQLDVPGTDPVELRFTQPGGALDLRCTSLPLPPGGRSLQLDLPSGKVAGTVDPSALTPGKPLRYRWTGDLEGQDFEALWHVEPDDTGSFTLDPVPAGHGALGYWVSTSEWPGKWTEIATTTVTEGGTAKL